MALRLKAPYMTSVAVEQGMANRMLASIPAAELARLQPMLEEMDLPINSVLLAADGKAKAVYFPTTAIASIVAHPGKSMIEAATVGREGFVGLPVFLGGISSTTTIIQIAGNGYRVRASEFVAALRECPQLTALLNRYSIGMMDEASLTAGCNRTHPLEERCAKWLLLIHDRTDGASFELTHKFLAVMLGVRRAGVTVAAGTLQSAGIIRYSRGKVTVLDRDALEKASCSCYRKLQDIQQRIFAASN